MSDTPAPSVVLCQPNYGYTSTIAHMHQMSWLAKSVRNNEVHYFEFLGGHYISHARNELVFRALQTPATHLFFLDQDVCPAPGTIAKLLQTDANIVSGIYVLKDHSAKIVAWTDDPYTLLDSYDPTGIQRVDGVGMGCVLIKTDVLRAMTEEFGPDHLFHEYNAGEDVYFARQYRKLFPNEEDRPVLDGRVFAGHVGDQIFTKYEFDMARGLESLEKHREQRGTPDPNREDGT